MLIKNFTIISLLSEIIFPSLPISILCCVSIYILHKDEIILQRMISLLCTAFLVGVILATGSYILILPLLSIITILQLKKDDDVNKGNIESLMIIFILYFISIISIAIFCKMFCINEIVTLKYGILLFLFALVSIIIIFESIKFVFYKKNFFKNTTVFSIRTRMILSISIPIAISIRLIYPFAELTNGNQAILITEEFIPKAIPLITMILILIVIYNYDKSVKNEVALRREIEEKYRIEEYAHMIEDLYSETRRFKHDYINMLTPLKEYIDNNDMSKLKEFFYDNVIDMDKDIKWSNNNIDKLKYIKLTGLKALLSTKLIKAISMKVDIKVEIIEEISKISMNIMDLCRIIGILMNNAMEAAEECKNPKLHLCIVNKQEYVVITIENNFEGEKPVIHKIYKEGYSAKGSGRGLGLYTVKNIIDTKYENVCINTSIEEGMFIQELWIKG